jgi:hypothetical protein
MKKSLILGGLMAAMLAPVAAQAQSREVREERRDVREERREYRDAQRYGDRGDVREERREYRDAQRDLREAKRDWRQDRRYGNYRAPFAYRQFNVGVTLRPGYYAPAFRPAYDARWGLPRAGRNLTYVRHYNDLLLVNERNGRVVRVYRNHFRWR